MSKELKLNKQLDQHLKQVKVGETTAPIEISTKEIRFNEKTTIEKSLQLNGDLNIVGSVGTLNFPDQIVLESSEAQGALNVEAAGLTILSALWAGTDGDSGNNDASLTLFPSAGQDAKIIMYGNASLQWTIGNDNDDSDKLKFDVGTTTVGGDTKMTLDDSGNLTLVGDLAVNGDNITWAFWRIDEGSELPEHKHIHEQIMHVIDGKIKFTFDGKTLVHGPGSIVVIPSNMPHSGVALTQCKIMDVFTPVREDL